MKHKTHIKRIILFQRAVILCVSILLCCVAHDVYAQKSPKKTMKRASRYSYLPSGYTQVGTTQLYYKQYSDAIDVIGYYNGYYYSSTYDDYGYKLSIQVGSNSATRVDCLNGTTNNGVTVQPFVEQQGELARVCYTVTNTNDADVTISMGVHADVMIGYNDGAPIARRIDTFGQTYGLTMMDGNGAQLCVLFGSGLAGVTAVSDFWFGYWSDNSDAYNMVGNYYQTWYWMLENGSYDSGMGWCWKERTINAGSTVVFSYMIGVGEVNLEPNSSFEVTPDDPEGWNDLSRPHRLTLNGSYESPAGLDGVIDYAVEDSEDWIALTDTLKSGDEFSASLDAMFDVTKVTHIIKFRTRDMVGNTTMLHPIEYGDVSFHALTGIEEKTFTGDSLFQTNVVCDLNSEHYALTAYRNNVNAGTASFNIEGVFPYTIGRKTYTFTINPQPLEGGLSFAESTFVYNGQSITPDWQFTNGNYNELENDKDYTEVWSNNKLPGTATLTVTGKNNYTGTITGNFTIDKAQLVDSLFTLTLPNEDITYDEKSHGASITKSEGVGEATITYQKQGEVERTANQPIEAGDYTVFLEFADGSLYYGRALAQVGTFSIYQFDAGDWTLLQTIIPQLTEMGWSQPWDTSQGMKSVSSIKGLNIEQGHITGVELANQNLTGAFPFVLLSLPQLQSINLANNKLSGDIGTATYAFAQQNPEQVANIKALDVSGNQFSGNIGLFANSFPSLTSLNASNNNLEDVVPMISPNVTSLDLSKQETNRVVEVNLSDTAQTWFSKIPTILTYQHEQQTYGSITDANIYCSTIDGDWGFLVIFKVMGLPERKEYYGQSGDTLRVVVLDNIFELQGSSFFVKLNFDQGDSNFDGQVNVLDLQTTINYMFQEYDNLFNYTAANLWQDDVINVQDAVCLVNKLLNSELQSGKMMLRRAAGELPNTMASILVDEDQLIIDTSVPVSAFDIIVNMNGNCEVIDALTKLGFTCVVKQNGNMAHIIGYSFNGITLPIGKTAICHMTNGSVIYAMLADENAREIKVNIDNSTTDVDSSTINMRNKNVVYKIPLDANHSIIIESTGRKTMIKNEK